jgi:hypothetical protein
MQAPHKNATGNTAAKPRPQARTSRQRSHRPNPLCRTPSSRQGLRVGSDCALPGCCSPREGVGNGLLGRAGQHPRLGRAVCPLRRHPAGVDEWSRNGARCASSCAKRHTHVRRTKHLANLTASQCTATDTNCPMAYNGLANIRRLAWKMDIYGS